MSNSSPIRKRRAAAAALACAFALAGCSSDSDTSWSDIYQAAKMSFAASAPAVSLKEAAAVPFASMGVRLGDGPQTMVVLASDTEDGQLWTSVARIALMTRGGRIMRTSGFTHNLSGAMFTNSDPLPAFADPDAAPRDSTRQVDFWSMKIFSVTLRCRMVSRGQDAVVILGTRIQTHRVEETCRSDRLDWSFTNTFWMDRSGLVWKSLQYVHPDLSPIDTEILRPPTAH